MVSLYGFAKVYSQAKTGRKAIQKEIAYTYNLLTKMQNIYTEHEKIQKHLFLFT